MSSTSRRKIIKIAAGAATTPLASSVLRTTETERRLGRGGPFVSVAGLDFNNYGGCLDAAGHATRSCTLSKPVYDS